MFQFMRALSFWRVDPTNRHQITGLRPAKCKSQLTTLRERCVGYTTKQELSGQESVVVVFQKSEKTHSVFFQKKSGPLEGRQVRVRLFFSLAENPGSED